MHLVNLNPPPLIVIPAQAGIQLHALRRFKLDLTFVGSDDGKRQTSFPVTSLCHIFPV
jgi:hypothetical protein